MAASNSLDLGLKMVSFDVIDFPGAANNLGVRQRLQGLPAAALTSLGFP